MIRFSDFIGNERLVELVRRSRLPHAMLFAGPNGVGKRTLALSLAAFKNCLDPSDDDLCGRCSSCLKTAAGGHPDIRVFEPEKNLIRIDAMREMSREAQFRPFQGRLRFFIVDQAEKMNEEAANSILKTLEEPPETSKMILVTAFPQRLLPTIRSRCQLLSFHPVEREQIETCLRRHECEEVELRAAFADGSIGRALALDLEQLIEDRNQMLDLMLNWGRQASFEMLYKACEQEPLKSDLRDRARAVQYLEILQQLCEDIYSLQVAKPERVVNRDRIEDLKPLAERLTLDSIRDFLYHASQSQWEIEHYVSALMSFETLWLKWLYAGNRYSSI